jgi:hypothetical protein
MSFQDLILFYSQPSLVLDKRERDKITRLCDASLYGLEEMEKRWFKSHSRDTILQQYGADLTPLTTMEQYKQSAEGITVLRKGSVCNEFLIQRQISTDLRGSVCCRLELPYVLKDKTAFAHFSSYRTCFKTPRELGHEGLSVILHRYDGAIVKPMNRLNLKYRAASYDRLKEELGPHAYMSWILDWYFSVTCILHDIQGAVKWSVFAFTRDKDVMRSSFLCMESLRRGYSQLVKHAGHWLLDVLEFTDEPWHVSRAVYLLLGVDGDWLEKYCDLEMRWKDGRLLVSSRHRGYDSAYEYVMLVLLHAWKFTRWTTSRFLTFGRGGRQLILSALFGLPSLVAFSLARGASEYYLGGFQKHWTPTVQLLTCIVAVTSWLGDKAHGLVFKDDRLPRVLVTLEAIIGVEVSNVAMLSEAVLACLATIIGHNNSVVLGNTLVAASMTSACYLQMRLRDARKGAWSLLQGDWTQNLLDLQHQPAPTTDEGLFKVYETHRVFGIEKALEGLHAMSLGSWSTNLEEQGHNYASGLVKAHRGCSASTIQDWSVVRMFRQLVSESRDARILMQLEKRIAALEKKLSRPSLAANSSSKT